jgi:hypothetical protein
MLYEKEKFDTVPPLEKKGINKKNDSYTILALKNDPKNRMLM